TSAHSRSRRPSQLSSSRPESFLSPSQAIRSFPSTRWSSSTGSCCRQQEAPCVGRGQDTRTLSGLSEALIRRFPGTDVPSPSRGFAPLHETRPLLAYLARERLVTVAPAPCRALNEHGLESRDSSFCSRGEGRPGEPPFKKRTE